MNPIPTSAPYSSAYPDRPYYDRRNLPAGYPRLAGLMGEDGGKYLIFRSFSALGARSVLRYQAHLSDLEKKLIQRENQSLQQNGRHAHSWMDMQSNSFKEENDFFCDKIRPVLKDYHEELIRLSTIHHLESPRSFDVEHVRSFLANKEMGPYTLSGEDKAVWGVKPPRPEREREEAPDLISINASPRQDVFTNFVRRNGVAFFFKARSWMYKDAADRVDDFYVLERNLLFFVRFITCLIACIIPIIPIAALSGSSTKALGIVVGLNFLLAICLVFFATAEPAHVFGITATFGALQVAVVTNSTKNAA